MNFPCLINVETSTLPYFTATWETTVNPKVDANGSPNPEETWVKAIVSKSNETQIEAFIKGWRGFSILHGL